MEFTEALVIGRPEGSLVSGSVRSAEEHGLPYELLDAEELRRRSPALEPGPEEAALHEETALSEVTGTAGGHILLGHNASGEAVTRAREGGAGALVVGSVGMVSERRGPGVRPASWVSRRRPERAP